MRWPHRVAALLLCATASLGVAVAFATPAQAHPLGNFTVNHYHGLRLYPDHLEDTAVLDEAEIPTLQDRTTIDGNGDGTATTPEQSAFAAATCLSIANGLHTTVNGNTVAWSVAASAFSYHAGAASLQTGRTQCQLRATIDLSTSAALTATDTYRADRVGWHEFTASGHHVQLTNSPVAATSISDELRHYPNDLLSSPLDERAVRLTTVPGTGRTGPTPVANVSGTDPFTRALAAVTGRFNNLVGSPQLTPVIGLLGVLLALILGGAHAALPGHGKTVMAAYIAGRRGRTRDAITVGATVTATHTFGVLILGLVFTLVAGLAGETLLGWLGAASGLLIAGIGLALLKTAVFDRPRRPKPGNRSTRAATPQLVGSGAPSTGDEFSLLPGRPPGPADQPTEHHEHGHPHHHHDHAHDHHHHHEHRDLRLGRRGLIGMGIAGGLVPSPSALIVLLGAIALGRTWFGVLLVIAYGAGMAATLTATGLLLVHLTNRVDSALSRRVGQWSVRLASATPILTAALVLVVGLGMTLRSALPLLGAG